MPSLFNYPGGQGAAGLGAGNSAYGNKDYGGSLEPGSTGGLIDIVKDFHWTLTPEKARQEVPYVYLQEKIVLQSQLKSMFTTFSQVINQGLEAAQGAQDLAPYQGLYDNTFSSGFYYKFPYFSDASFANTNTWTEVNQVNLTQLLNAGKSAASGAVDIVAGIAGLRSKRAVTAARTAMAGHEIVNGVASGIGAVNSIATLGALAFMAGNNPRVKMVDKPMMWDNGNNKSVTVEFPLYNVVDEASIQKNWEFCFLFTYQNLYNKLTYFTADPPVIYEYEIPGVHYSRAAYVSNIAIQNKGNIRKFSVPGVNGDVLIPDAYWVSITLTDLLVNSKNLFKLVGLGNGIAA
jgi:hypothetical protein